MQNDPKPIALSSIGFWLCLAFLLAVTAAFHAKPVPFNNEFLYLLRLEPGFLLNDWSFSQPANEHWLFNALFSIPARFLAIETLAWLGRVVFWLLCLAVLIRLGSRWLISMWAVAVSIALWLALIPQAVNAEWIIGTFEAKPVAYACLLFALDGFARRAAICPAILLGLSFSFHPAVGLWAIPAVGVALIAMERRVADLFKIVGVTFIFALPGLLALVFEQTSTAAATAADWQFIVKTHMPYHFDPFAFPAIGMAMLGLMFGFTVMSLWRTESFALRFLLFVQVALAGFFVLGIALRVFEQFSLLRLMPMRLFPMLTPLFFFFSAFYLMRRLDLGAKKVIAGFFFAAIIAIQNPVSEGINQLRETLDAWRAKPNDLERTLAWTKENTPPDAVLIAPSISRKVWHLSRRAQVVSFQYPRYDRLSEWRSRLADVGANVDHNASPTVPDAVEAGFDNLSADQMRSLKEKYAGQYLITRTSYPFPVIFETDTYKLYQLP